MKWLLCRVFKIHQPGPWVDARWAIKYECQRCNEVVSGRMGR